MPAIDAATGALLGAVIGAVTTLAANALQARSGRKAAQITAEGQAWIQTEKLRHDAALAEVAFKREKLEDLYQAVARAAAYSTLSVAVLRSDNPPAPERLLERYDEDMGHIHKAQMIAELYFRDLAKPVKGLGGLIDHALFVHRAYFKVEPGQGNLQRASDEVAEVAGQLSDLLSELRRQVGEEASRLSGDIRGSSGFHVPSGEGRR